MNQKIDKNGYYYLHGTENESSETLEDIFTHGLRDEYGTSLGLLWKNLIQRVLKELDHHTR